MSISLESVGRSFGEKVALRDVHLEVKRGQIVALLGANGAGKTTAIRVLLGLITPDQGRVTQDGGVVSERELKEVLAYVHADAGITPRLTPREQLAFSLAAEGGSKEGKNRVESTISILGLGELADQKMETLSSGNKQRVLVGQVLIRNAPYLVLDEPTANLDLMATQEILRILEDAKGKGRGILLSTHQVWIAERIADVVIVLHEGCSVAKWERGDFPEEGLAAAFLKVSGI